MNKVLSSEDIDSSKLKDFENEKEIEILPESNLFNLQMKIIGIWSLTRINSSSLSTSFLYSISLSFELFISLPNNTLTILSLKFLNVLLSFLKLDFPNLNLEIIFWESLSKSKKDNNS